jgi:hypothetical protein
MRNILVGALLLAACGGDGGSSTRAITTAEAEALCRTDCQHDFDCGNETDVDLCTSSCADEIDGWVRLDAAEVVFECFAALECSASDDGCILEVEPLAIHEEWEDGCRSVLAPSCPDFDAAICEVSGGEAAWMVVAPEVMQQFIACLDGADCGARLACIEGLIEQYGIDF